MKISNLIIRYIVATVGLFFVAMGTALSIKSNLGTSPLSSPAYVLADVWGLSVGTWTIIVNLTYTLGQILILRKNFKAKYLMQIPASLVFGSLIDLCMLIVGGIVVTSLTSRIVLIVLACLVTALGVSIEVIARGWMLSAEMLVYVISKTFRHDFKRVKIIMDSMHVVISAVLAFLIWGNFFGRAPFETFEGVLLGTSPGVAIGIGTILMAFLAGGFMKLTDPIANALMDQIIKLKIFKDDDTQQNL